jgi:hypothetical protein
LMWPSTFSRQKISQSMSMWRRFEYGRSHG